MRNYIFIPKISVKPDRVTLFNEVLWYGKGENQTEKTIRTAPAVPVVKKFHGFKISNSAQKKIHEKVTWLYTLAKARYIKTYSGKEIKNFKILFLTLTLPSIQKHPTATITNELFNHFMTEMRQRTKIENYVWRLEFQGNGNVHFHIVTDCYIDYFFALKIWNRICNKLGYVDAYTEKMKRLSLNDYFLKYGKDQHEKFNDLAKRYAKGVSQGWTQPPSVDVKICTSAASISHYIAKYFSKKSPDNPLFNALDNEDNSFSLRLWFCSRSLSKLTSIVEFEETAIFRPDLLIKFAEGVKTYYAKYATCFFFQLNKMSNYVKSLLYPYFTKYAISMNYQPCLSNAYDPPE